MKGSRTPLDAPIALFVVSALIGVWASFDPATSRAKFGLILLAVVLYYLIVWSGIAEPLSFRPSPTPKHSPGDGGGEKELNRGTPPRAQSGVSRLNPISAKSVVLVWLFLLASAVLAVYFVTQNDYGAQPGKFDAITRLGLFLDHLSPQLNWHQPNANIVSGVLEIAVPVNVAMLLRELRIRNRESRIVPLLVSLSTCLLISFALLMSSSRGAWLALAAVGVGALAIAVGGRVITHWRIARRVWIPISLSAAFIGVIGLFRFGDPNWLEDWLGVIPVGQSAVSRVELFGQAWGLIHDYAFTGAGLGVFPMVFSTYALLINVPFLTHAHNLFLEIWIEQGILGAVAFIWLVVAFYLWAAQLTAVRGQESGVSGKRIELSWLTIAGIAATTVMLLHGFLDVLLYSSRALPLLLVPMGLAVAGMQNSKLGIANWELRIRSPRLWAIGVGAVLLVAVGLVASPVWNQISAMWYANLGSVAEARVELGGYSFPDRLVEYTRRECESRIVNRELGNAKGLERAANCGELREAEDYLTRALDLDAGNVTASQRLAAIELAGGGYNAALAYAQSAYERDATNPVTWQLLGDAHLALGQVDEASGFWSRVSGAPAKLQDEAWVRYDKNGDTQRAAWANQLAAEVRAIH